VRFVDQFKCELERAIMIIANFGNDECRMILANDFGTQHHLFGVATGNRDKAMLIVD
jgi:hypothetical protein